MRRANPMGAATAVIVIAALACATLSAGGALAPTPRPKPSTSPTADLARCRALGEAGGADPVCHAAWSEQRRWFFGAGATGNDRGDQTLAEAGR